MMKYDPAINSTLNQDRIEPNKYNLIYADPAWRFKNWSIGELTTRGEKWARRNGRSSYPVMTIEDICNLPVGNLAAKNAVLLMWVTDPKLEEGLQVIKAWGFTYKTIAFHWVKQNPSGVGFHFGLGYHTRANPEVCLLATRGKGLKRVDNTVPRLIISPLEEHSKKPAEAYQRIERLYGNVPSVELFARRAMPSWSAWGNEVECSPEVIAALGQPGGLEMTQEQFVQWILKQNLASPQVERASILFATEGTDSAKAFVADCQRLKKLWAIKIT